MGMGQICYPTPKYIGKWLAHHNQVCLDWKRCMEIIKVPVQISCNKNWRGMALEMTEPHTSFLGLGENIRMKLEQDKLLSSTKKIDTKSNLYILNHC